MYGCLLSITYLVIVMQERTLYHSECWSLLTTQKNLVITPTSFPFSTAIYQGHCIHNYSRQLIHSADRSLINVYKYIIIIHWLLYWNGYSIPTALTDVSNDSVGNLNSVETDYCNTPSELLFQKVFDTPITYNTEIIVYTVCIEQHAPHGRKYIKYMQCLW